MLTRFDFKYATLGSEARTITYLSNDPDLVDEGEDSGLSPGTLVDLIEDDYDLSNNYRAATLQDFVSLFAMCCKIAFQHNGVLWNVCNVYRTGFGSDDPDDLAFVRSYEGINYEHPDNPSAQTFEASLTAGIYGRTLLANAVRPYMLANLSTLVLNNIQEGNAILVSQLTSPDAYLRFIYRFFATVRDNRPVAVSSYETVENSIVGLRIKNKIRTSTKRRP